MKVDRNSLKRLLGWCPQGTPFGTRVETNQINRRLLNRKEVSIFIATTALVLLFGGSILAALIKMYVDSLFRSGVEHISDDPIAGNTRFTPLFALGLALTVGIIAVLALRKRSTHSKSNVISVGSKS